MLFWNRLQSLLIDYVWCDGNNNMMSSWFILMQISTPRNYYWILLWTTTIITSSPLSIFVNVPDDAQYMLCDCKNRRVRWKINKNKIEIKSKHQRASKIYHISTLNITSVTSHLMAAFVKRLKCLFFRDKNQEYLNYVICKLQFINFSLISIPIAMEKF